MGLRNFFPSHCHQYMLSWGFGLVLALWTRLSKNLYRYLNYEWRIKTANRPVFFFFSLLNLEIQWITFFFTTEKSPYRISFALFKISLSYSDKSIMDFQDHLKKYAWIFGFRYRGNLLYFTVIQNTWKIGQKNSTVPRSQETNEWASSADQAS